MPLPALLAPLVGWIFRDVVVKFMVLVAVYAVLAIVVPMAVGYVAPFVAPAGLTNAFLNLSPGVWFFLDGFALGYGVPLVISAYVARFLIRRLPFIG